MNHFLINCLSNSLMLPLHRSARATLGRKREGRPFPISARSPYFLSSVFFAFFPPPKEPLRRRVARYFYRFVFFFAGNRRWWYLRFSTKCLWTYFFGHKVFHLETDLFGHLYSSFHVVLDFPQIVLCIFYLSLNKQTFYGHSHYVISYSLSMDYVNFQMYFFVKKEKNNVQFRHHIVVLGA